MADISQIKLPNGDTFDLIDEKSGYITAQYIENKTDYSIPVSRVGEIKVGETVIGTDSTNFPTSKAVVDYVDERVVQEIEAINAGVTSVNGKTGTVTLSASDLGALSSSTYIPQYTSDLTNDSGFLQAQVTNSENDTFAIEMGGNGTTTAGMFTTFTYNNGSSVSIPFRIIGNGNTGTVATTIYGVVTPRSDDMAANKKYVDDSIPQVYSSTNTGGYLTMATLPIYDGTVE